MWSNVLRIAAIACVTCAASQGHAALILDQSYEGPANVGISLGPTVRLAQSFTPSVTGELGGFDFRFQAFGLSPGTLVFWDIRGAVSGVPQLPDAPVLASGSIDVSSLSGAEWLEVRGLSIPMTFGDDMAIVIRHNAPVFVGSWQKNEPGGYSPGRAYARSDLDPAWFDQGGDFLFRTYANESEEPTGVPEPSSAVVAAIGLGGLYVRKRRQRKQI